MSFKNVSFEDHVEKLNKDLGVFPTVLKSKEADLMISKFKVKTNGGFDHKTNTIAIKDPNRIGTLAHEMRHAWQYKNKDKYHFHFSNKTDSNMIASITYLLGYLFSIKEWDANIYAYKYCKKVGLTKIATEYSLTLIFNGLFILAVLTILIYLSICL